MNGKREPHPETKEIVENLRRTGQAIIEVANALEGFDREAAIRILRSVAILHGVDLEAVGLRELVPTKGG
jgi:hypothetical protein